MNKDLREKNLKLVFDEIKQQFDYTSKLFDNLESRINVILVFIGIIIALSFNEYFLGLMAGLGWIIFIPYLLGLSLIIFAVYKYLFNLRRRKFKIINISNLKKKYLKEPERDFYKIIGGNYLIPIKENLKHYHNKEKELDIAMLYIKAGFIVLLSVFLFVKIYSFIE